MKPRTADVVDLVTILGMAALLLVAVGWRWR